MPHRGPYRVVQPWGPDRARQATIVSDGHPTAAAAYAELDRLQFQMLSTGVQPDTVELLVVDGQHRIVSRPAAH